MKWKAFHERASFYVLAYSWMVLLLSIIVGCTFKIIIPNNFKTEHTFHIKMDYPTSLPFWTDTTKHGGFILDTIPLFPIVINPEPEDSK